MSIECKEILGSVVILILAFYIIYINKNRNAWDIMFYNTTLSIITLFVIGLIYPNIWTEIVYCLGLVATGTGIAAAIKGFKK